MNLVKGNQLTLKWLGIDTYKEAVIYMHKNCHVCKAEGFEVHSRIRITLKDKSIIATINHISNGIINPDQASLSQYAWNLLDAKEGDVIQLAYSKPLTSLSYVRSKIYGKKLKTFEIDEIIKDISEGRYSDIHISAFLTACASGGLNESEIIDLTQSMINVGERLSWSKDMIVDKHCVGGLPGNRTTPIIVSIVSSFGLTMPKTSSRAITSPAGTADTMETLAPVNLSLKEIRRVVDKEQGCIVWGGAVNLSPADDILIRVERAIELDSEGQLIASVISKKISAGSTHIVIDIPVGPTAKVRTVEKAHSIEYLFRLVGEALGIKVSVIRTDGSQPVGRGIGPALEAIDVLAVLQNTPEAPKDLKRRALLLAGEIIDFSPKVKHGEGINIATEILESGIAWKKFQAICEAQGGLREPPMATYTHTISSHISGKVKAIDNRRLAHLAKMAGAPLDKAAGIKLYTPLGDSVYKGDALYTIHAESKGSLRYALSFLEDVPNIVIVEPEE